MLISVYKGLDIWSDTFAKMCLRNAGIKYRTVRGNSPLIDNMDVKSVGGIDGTAVLQYARVIFGGYF